jgi:predicted nucleotidyltransferase
MMSDNADPEAPTRSAALAFAEEMASFWSRQLGSRRIAAYLIGSLAHGGFSRRYSDIDMALIVEDGLGESEFADMRAHAMGLSAELAPKLSLFWADRGFTVGRFPPLDRVDLVDHAVALDERERVWPPRPALAEIRTYLRGTPFANWRDGARLFATATTLAPADRKPFIRALLYPARFVYSWMTGAMASNDEAVAFTAAVAPAGLDLGLIESALSCRRAADDPDALFGARSALPRQVDACARLLDQ